jgi:hypothetical protein
MTSPSAEKTWDEVARTHRSQSGISVLDGRVRSLLCNQHKLGHYADEVCADKILYRVTTNTPSKGVLALERMVGSQSYLTVFEKIAKNRWLDHGLWVVSQSAPEEPDGRVFLLLPESHSPKNSSHLNT